jgi:glycosyltransferase involved in cell wall biosynthesis
MKQNKFTVIIPTRERANTLIHTIKTVIDQKYENLVVLICDNFSQDNTEEIVSTFKDERLKYINTGKRLSMSHNWEFALTKVSEGYVTIIGDDDGLLPNCFDIVNDLINTFNVEAIISSDVFFSWKDRKEFLSNSFSIPQNIDFGLKIAHEELRKVLSFEQSYYTLPSLYKGFISVDAIERVKIVSKDFFHSMTPDLYSTLVLSSKIDKYYVSEIPFAINGASAHSGGSSYFKPTKKEGESPAHKFLSEDNIPFDKSLILFPSIPIILYEAYLQAKKQNIIPNGVGSDLSSALLKTLKDAVGLDKLLYDKTIKGLKDNAELNGLNQFTDELFKEYENQPKSKLSKLVANFNNNQRYIVCPQSCENIYDAYNYYKSNLNRLLSLQHSKLISIPKLLLRYFFR